MGGVACGVGGGVSWCEGARSAWSQATSQAACQAESWSAVLGAPLALSRLHTEAGRVKLHRRLRAAAYAARCATLNRRRALRAALALHVRLCAQEKGFWGAAVTQRRGLWLGALRALKPAEVAGLQTQADEYVKLAAAHAADLKTL